MYSINTLESDCDGVKGQGIVDRSDRCKHNHCDLITTLLSDHSVYATERTATLTSHRSFQDARPPPNAMLQDVMFAPSIM